MLLENYASSLSVILKIWDKKQVAYLCLLTELKNNLQLAFYL